jgi:hypothetical protein
MYEHSSSNCGSGIPRGIKAACQQVPYAQVFIRIFQHFHQKLLSMSILIIFNLLKILLLRIGF